MKPYDKQVTLRQIGFDGELKEAYFERLSRNNNDYDEACWQTFSADIAGHQTRMAHYERIFDELTAAVLPDSPLVAHIRKLVSVNGWDAFRASLIQFSLSKESQMRKLGLKKQAEQWEQIKDKFESLRKTVQL